jgi:hypothetical protein
MLLTETWERLEYLAIEPSQAHLLLVIAQMLGYKHQKNTQKTQQQSSPGEIQAALGSFPKASYAHMPEWIKNSPGFQKLVAELRS